MYCFQNYHLILYCPELQTDIENSIDRYLIPTYATKAKQNQSYMKFYKENLDLGNSIIRDIDGAYTEIKNYLKLKVEESKAAFEALQEEDEY